MHVSQLKLTPFTVNESTWFESWGELDAIRMDQSWIRKVGESCVRRGGHSWGKRSSESGDSVQGEAINCRHSQESMLGDRLD